MSRIEDNFDISNIEDQLDKICIKHHSELPMHEQMNNLADALIENILNTPDDEILKEVEDDYGTKYFLADKVRAIFTKVAKKYGFK